MLLILVLHELAQMPERLGALRALVWLVGHAAAPASVCEHRSAGQIRTHAALLLSEVVNLAPRVVLAFATRAVAALYVLDGVCARPEPRLAANLFATDEIQKEAQSSSLTRTGNVTWAMGLHMHSKLVRGVENPVAFRTFVRDRLRQMYCKSCVLRGDAGGLSVTSRVV